MKVRGLFGDIDANVEKERKNLRKYFINTTVFNEVTDSEIYLLRGFKGSGKTALLQRLSMCGKICEECNLVLKFCDLGKFGIIYINADDILTRFSDTIVEDYAPPQFDLERAWMNIIKVASYERVITDHGDNNDKLCLKAFNDSKEFKDTRYEKIVDIALELIVTTFTPVRADTQKITDSLWAIFKDPKGKYSDVESSAIKLLQSTDMMYYVVFDGFDHIPLVDKKAATNFVRNLTYSLMTFGYKYNFLREGMGNIPNVHVKIFLPEDFTFTAEIRDNIKYINRSELLQWKTYDLKKFIAVRTYAILKKHKKGLNLNFSKQNTDYLWKKMFGARIDNLHYSIKTKETYLVEDTFRYILRHTLYRARDLQIICEQIVKAADEKHSFENKQAFVESLPIDSEAIRTGVNRGSRELVSRLFEEFALMDLAGLINQFQTGANIINYNIVRDKVEKYRGINEQPIDKKLQLLYDVGFLGKFFRGTSRIKSVTRPYGECKKVIDSYPIEYYMSVFSFAGNFKETISQDDELVVAPMFNDYLNMGQTVDDKYLIEPVCQ